MIQEIRTGLEFSALRSLGALLSGFLQALPQKGHKAILMIMNLEWTRFSGSRFRRALGTRSVVVVISIFPNSVPESEQKKKRHPHIAYREERRARRRRCAAAAAAAAAETETETEIRNPKSENPCEKRKPKTQTAMADGGRQKQQRNRKRKREGKRVHRARWCDFFWLLWLATALAAAAARTNAII
jgi:hypothetical protein